jgi:hypothetical protein
MKTNLTKHLLAAAILVLATSAFAQDAEKPINVSTDGLPDHVKARILEKAQQGPTALIRYVNSTRHIHNLRVEMIVKPDDAATMAKVVREPSKVAENMEKTK